jgi:exopolysaccharide biosynthesis protein
MPRPAGRLPRSAVTSATGVVAAVLLLPALSATAAVDFTLPLGDADLPEVRTVRLLAPGVELMTITRGTEPARSDRIGTTTRGPWRVNVLSIDPRVATGQLRAAYGPDLARVEKTSDLVVLAGALAGVNASYFTFSKNRTYPGDPVGLSVGRGVLLSEPGATSTEVDLLVDAATNAVRLGRLSWSGSMRNSKTGAKLKLEFVNHPPVVPKACAKLSNPTRCKSSGDVTLFTPEFGPTPRGRGVEAILDTSGCVVKVRASRGRTLASGQSSVQATGKQAKKLKALTTSGCLSRSLKLFDADGKAVKLTDTTYGVAGRYWLTRAGSVVAKAQTGSYHARNPRTIVGTAADGTIHLVTIDGRRSTSVGATLVETAKVAQSLGLRDAINLDGGGSTAMALATGLVNTPSGSVERAVGDALVYVG